MDCTITSRQKQSMPEGFIYDAFMRFLAMNASRSIFLYFTSRPIFTHGKLYRPVDFQIASVCSAIPKYAAASLRVSKSELCLLNCGYTISLAAVLGTGIQQPGF